MTNNKETMALNFEKYASKGNEVLKELAEELNDPGNKVVAGKLLRGVLHTVRNIIPLEESFQFIAQLPLILKGVYVDGWTPLKKHERIKHLDEFVEQVFVKAKLDPKTHFPRMEPEEVVKAVIRVLRQHVSQGEIDDIRSSMPKGLIELWDEFVWFV